MLNCTISSSFFPLFVDNRLKHSMYRGLDDHFLIFSSIPVHVNSSVTMALNKVNCSLWVKVPFLLSAQSFDFWTFLKMTSLKIWFISGFSAREVFPGH